MNSDHGNNDLADTIGAAFIKTESDEQLQTVVQNLPRERSTKSENSEGGIVPQTSRSIISQLNSNTPERQRQRFEKKSSPQRFSKAFHGLSRTNSENLILMSKTLIENERNKTSTPRRKSLCDSLKARNRDERIGKSHDELSFLNFLYTSESDNVGCYPKLFGVHEHQSNNNLAVIQADLQTLCAEADSEIYCNRNTASVNRERNRAKSVNDTMYRSYFDPVKMSENESSGLSNDAYSSTLMSYDYSPQNAHDLSKVEEREHNITCMQKRTALQGKMHPAIGHAQKDYLGISENATQKSNLLQLNKTPEMSIQTDEQFLESSVINLKKTFLHDDGHREKELLPDDSQRVNKRRLHSSPNSVNSTAEIVTRLRSPLPPGLQNVHERNRSLSMGDVLQVLGMEQHELRKQLLGDPRGILHRFDHTKERGYPIKAGRNTGPTENSKQQSNVEFVQPQRRYSTSLEHGRMYLEEMGLCTVKEAGNLDSIKTQSSCNLKVDSPLSRCVSREGKSTLFRSFCGEMEHVSSTNCGLAEYTDNVSLKQSLPFSEGPTSKKRSSLHEDCNEGVNQKEDDQKGNTISETTDISAGQQSAYCNNNLNVRIMQTSLMKHDITDSSDEILFRSCSFTERRISRLNTFTLFLVSLWVTQCKRSRSRRHQKDIRTSCTKVVSSDINMKLTKTSKTTCVESKTLHKNAEILRENEQVSFEGTNSTKNVETLISERKHSLKEHYHRASNNERCPDDQTDVICFKSTESIESMTQISTQCVTDVDIGDAVNPSGKTVIDDISPPHSFKGTYHRDKLEAEKDHNYFGRKSGRLERNRLVISENKTVSCTSNLDASSSDDDVFYSQNSLGPLTPMSFNNSDIVDEVGKHHPISFRQVFPVSNANISTMSRTKDLLSESPLVSSEVDQNAMNVENIQLSIYTAPPGQTHSLINYENDPEITSDHLCKDIHSIVDLTPNTNEEMCQGKQAIGNENVRDKESNSLPKAKKEQFSRPKMADRCNSFRLDVFEPENPEERARIRSDESLWGQRVLQLFQNPSLLLNSPDKTRKMQCNTPVEQRLGLLRSPRSHPASDSSNVTVIPRPSTYCDISDIAPCENSSLPDSDSYDNSKTKLQIWRSGRVVSPSSPDFIMVRNRKNTERKIGVIDADSMRRAVSLVLEGHTLRSVSKDTGIGYTTLQRYVQKARKAENNANVSFAPNYACRRVLSDAEEAELEAYLLKASKMHYGLVSKQVRSLAYEYAEKNEKSFPTSWTDNRQAGEDWFFGFMKRHPTLSLRRPEATSLSRATSFNKSEVGVISEPQLDNLNEDDFVLVEFPTKRSNLVYVGQIRSRSTNPENGTDFEINFLRREKPSSSSFVFPQVEDVMDIKYDEIVGKLPKPMMQGGTARVARHLIFSVDFGKYAPILR